MPEDPGCAERMWTHEKYCESNKVGVVQIGETEPVIEHVPVDAGFSPAIRDSLLCGVYLLALFGVAFVIVGIGVYISKKLEDAKDNS